MKNLIKLILIILMMSLNMIAQARVIQKPELENLIREKIYNETYTEMKKYKVNSIDVKIINLPVDSVVINGEGKPQIKISSNFDRFLTYDIKKVVLLDEGRIIKTIPVNVRTLVYKDVLTATTRIAQFSSINSSNSKIKRMEVGVNIKNVIDNTNKEQLVATKPILQGGLVLKTATKRKPDIVKDMAVKIEFIQDNGFDITVDGVAQGEGNIGDIITVRNLRYNKVHTATIMSPNRVEVRL